MGPRFHRGRYRLKTMSTLTNVHNLPEPIVSAIRNDDYDPGDSDYTCTQIIKPVRIVHLTKRHDKEIVEDAADKIWLLMGNLMHQMFERAQVDNALVEERVFLDVLDHKISGAADLYLKDVLTDYKVTSAWTAVYKTRHEEWSAQLNILNHLFTSAGFPAKRLQIVAIYRDWSKSKALAGNGYPKAAVEVIPFPIWEKYVVQTFIHQRIKALIANEDCADDDLPECTPEDMWEKPTVWAVMREGRKSALRLLDTETAAVYWMTTERKGDEIVKRPGARTRCEDYCSVAPFCSQFKTYSQKEI